MNNIGKKVKELRRKNDLTQEELADFLGVTYKAVSKWECGLTTPDLSLIVPLSKVLGVTTDELLGARGEDSRRSELDEKCDNYHKYDQKEMYELALKAVREYPREYKYIGWLAKMEYYMAYEDEYKEDKSALYSSEMMDRSINHCNMVIEGCTDPRLRESAIWYAMICCRDSGRDEEALRYAGMFPEKIPLTRNQAMEICLQGEDLTRHLQITAHDALRDFCISLLELYSLKTKKEPYIMEALDTEEAVLKAVFPDENYLTFHWHLYCVYQKRAQLEIYAEEYDKAMEYLRIMIDHGQRCSDLSKSSDVGFSCRTFDRIIINPTKTDGTVPGIRYSDEDKASFIDKVKEELLTEEVYASLRHRDDFKSLFE